MTKSDRSMGIRAARAEYLERMEVIGDNLTHATRYEATPHDVIDDMLLSLDIDFGEFTFMDLGCGKGRALCLAAAQPFKRIVGVEFAKPLFEQAEINVAKFSAAWRRARRIDLLLQDAAAVALPEGPLLLYLFNPFRPPVLGSVVTNLVSSWEAAPRPIYVLYYMPEHAVVFTRCPLLEVVATARDWTIFRTPV